MESLARVTKQPTLSDIWTHSWYLDETGPQSTSLPECWPGTSSDIVVIPPERRRSVEDLVALEDRGMTDAAHHSTYRSLEKERDQTSARSEDNLVPFLEEIAIKGTPHIFSSFVERLDWTHRWPDELSAAIDLALRLEMAALAIDLAQMGAQLFPYHERIQRAARVLAPPIAHTTRLPPAGGMKASRRWLREHASEYRGQWVAVLGGQLMGVAPSLKELMSIIDLDEATLALLVTKVL